MFVVSHHDGDTTLKHESVLSHRNLTLDQTTRLLNSIYMFEHER